MRFAGFTLAALLIAASVGLAQPPAVPGAPVGVPPPLPAREAEDKLDAHLLRWQQKMADVKNMRTEIALKRTDPVLKREREYTGEVLCMKPNLAVLRLNYTGDKEDYEA